MIKLETHPRALIVLLVLALCLGGSSADQAVAEAVTRWWSEPVEQALQQARTNRVELVSALGRVPKAQQEGLGFLLENMPETDLRSLSADFLLSHMVLIYAAFEKAPGHDRVPKEIFLNDILPYACITETRDAWGKVLQEKCAPLVADCKTPAEAAQRLNERIFKLVNLQYSTKRAKADQSPLESMKSGLASCTGLSIMLVDACRSVGVPARLAGIPTWVDERGNHTWVEVWDGDWHFVGAAEPDAKGLDHAWFEHDASLARKDEPRHAIYASSFKKTGLAYPLDWGMSAVNVTDRYTGKSTPAEPAKMRLLVKVLDHLAGRRVAAKVSVTDVTVCTARLEGTSRDESADMNDILPFMVPRGSTYEIRTERDGAVASREFTAGTNEQAVVVISLADTTDYALPAAACCEAPTEIKSLKPAEEAELKQAMISFFKAAPGEQAKWKFSSRLEKLLRNNEPAVRRAAWEAYQSAPTHNAAKQDFDGNQARFGEYLSHYTVKTVGTRPTNGWALFIAMHGGGGAPKEVNDSQWEMMQRYYREHPESGGYRYVALRAPNDTWNGFYDDYVYPLVDNLIRQFLLFGDVAPNKVFIMGYSHGGYGAFAIGPKEPDLFAAIHASAAAPTDGETTGKTLRNTVFTCMVGENDTMYDRLSRDLKFRETIRAFRGSRTDIYPVTLKVVPGNGHGGLPDRNMIDKMYGAVRNPVPEELTWLMTDKVIKDFFWLRTESPGKEEEIDATCHDNHLTVKTVKVTAASLLLDSRLINFTKPVTLELNGKASTHRVQPSLRTLCETLQRRGDPELAFTAEIPLRLGVSGK
ncbi:MAG: polyhydroxyalkanoate depolymerase [Pedosphaera sp.]|nr:polyhydroxyalkanoate depolymerase [Pedosphaera sp.]